MRVNQQLDTGLSYDGKSSTSYNSSISGSLISFAHSNQAVVQKLYHCLTSDILRPLYEMKYYIYYKT